jgi:hypothetical protein
MEQEVRGNFSNPKVGAGFTETSVTMNYTTEDPQSRELRSQKAINEEVGVGGVEIVGKKEREK